MSVWESSPITERTIENLTSRRPAEETRLDEDPKGVAFKAEDRKCFKCNRPGHIANFCTESTQKGVNFKDNVARKICKKRNHRSEDRFFGKDETSKK